MEVSRTSPAMQGLGEELLVLCRSKEDKVAEVNALFELLSENQRREVVRYEDEVSESGDSYRHAAHDVIQYGCRFYNQLSIWHLTIY